MKLNNVTLQLARCKLVVYVDCRFHATHISPSLLTSFLVSPIPSGLEFGFGLSVEKVWNKDAREDNHGNLFLIQ
jgi:hypothetical protein